jgi:hypothetical protein
MIDLIRREIDLSRLPKKATNILEKCDPYINHFNQRADKPNEIPLYSDQYRMLDEKLKEDNQDITDRTYRGYRLVKLGGGRDQ